jgi:hypothetical protein
MMHIKSIALLLVLAFAGAQASVVETIGATPQLSSLLAAARRVGCALRCQIIDVVRCPTWQRTPREGPGKEHERYLAWGEEEPGSPTAAATPAPLQSIPPPCCCPLHLDGCCSSPTSWRPWATTLPAPSSCPTTR